MKITAKKPKLLTESYEDAQNRDISVGLHLAFREVRKYRKQDITSEIYYTKVQNYFEKEEYGFIHWEISIQSFVTDEYSCFAL